MQFRAQLLAQFNDTLTTRDTPRGLVLTITDPMFEHDVLSANAGQRLANVVAVLSSHPELNVRVEGYDESRGFSEVRAQAVRAALIARGARPDSVAAVGYGNTRPIVPNSTASGREQNRRVEVVVYGDSIGKRASGISRIHCGRNVRRHFTRNATLGWHRYGWLAELEYSLPRTLPPLDRARRVSR